MKFLHISDLHLGKKLGEFSLAQEQRDILEKIAKTADDEKVDCVIIAGDVYNKPVPPEESVQLFDDFLFRLSEMKKEVFIISGNHDSAERIAFGNRIMSRSGIHLSPVYSGSCEPVVMNDEYGEINVYMLPFIKPSAVRRFFPDTVISSYNDALKAAVKEISPDTSKRNLIITHQFITGASLSESEEIFIGGTENIDAEVFEEFDYAALGHIHAPQNITKKMRYCGTPLKYSKSEIPQQKSVTIAELKEKGSLEIKTIPLVPMHDVRAYKESFDTLTDKSFYSKINTEDFVYLTLTDKSNIPEAIHKLRKIYKRIVRLNYENDRTEHEAVIAEAEGTADITPIELFNEFYRELNNSEMTGQQSEYIKSVIEEIWEENIL